MNAKLLVTTSFPIVQIKRIDVLSTVLCVVSYFFFFHFELNRSHTISRALQRSLILMIHSEKNLFIATMVISLTIKSVPSAITITMSLRKSARMKEIMEEKD